MSPTGGFLFWKGCDLTATLRRFLPDDPTVYDFALFGAGEAGALADAPR